MPERPHQSPKQRQYSAEFRVSELTLSHYVVGSDAKSGKILDQLENDANLCGVVVISHDRGLVGIVPRRQVLEWMLRSPYGIDAYRSKPARTLVEFFDLEVLSIPSTCSAIDASSLAFMRTTETIFDPVVVDFGGGDFRLLDIQELLLAQTRIHQAMQAKLKQEQAQMQSVMDALREEKQRSQDYVSQLKVSKTRLEQQCELSRFERSEAQKRSEELATLNHHMVEVARVLTQEGANAFSATFDGVKKSRSLTKDIAKASEAMSQSMLEISTVTEVLGEVARDVRLLSFNVAAGATQE